MANAVCSFFNHSYFLFNILLVLSSTGQIQAWSARKLIHEFLHGLKFSITCHGGDLKAFLQIIDINSLECLKYVDQFSVCKVRHHCETDVPAESDKERYLVDEEYVNAH